MAKVHFDRERSQLAAFDGFSWEDASASLRYWWDGGPPKLALAGEIAVDYQLN